MNLLRDPWLPVRPIGGGQRYIRPAEMVNGIVSMAACRPDLDVAGVHFLIGLMELLEPSSDKWKAWMKTPPTVDELDAALAPFEPAFNLDGDGPLFMQDLLPGHEEADIKPVYMLPIGFLSNSAVDQNADIFARADQLTALSRSTAALVLMSHTFTPGIGGGFKQGLRGNGPLSMLALPKEETLWNLVWLNVMTTETPQEDLRMDRIFPWFTPARKLRVTDVDPRYKFWSMSRRIRLRFDPTGGMDSFTNEHDQVVIREFTELKGGNDYHGDWKHPFTPFAPPPPSKKVPPKDGGAVQIRAGGLGHWASWPEVVFGSKDLVIAQTLKAAMHPDRRRYYSGRLWSHGFECKQAKVCNFVEGTMPALQLGANFEAEVRKIVDAASFAATLLRVAVCKAWGKDNIKAAKPVVAGLSKRLGRGDFWQLTQTAFYDTIQEIAKLISSTDEYDAHLTHPVREKWHELLCSVAEQVFKRTVGFDSLIVTAPDHAAKSILFLRGALHAQKIKRILGIEETVDAAER